MTFPGQSPDQSFIESESGDTVKCLFVYTDEGQEFACILDPRTCMPIDRCPIAPIGPPIPAPRKNDPSVPFEQLPTVVILRRSEGERPLVLCLLRDNRVRHVGADDKGGLHPGAGTQSNGVNSDEKEVYDYHVSAGDASFGMKASGDAYIKVKATIDFQLPEGGAIRLTVGGDATGALMSWDKGVDLLRDIAQRVNALEAFARAAEAPPSGGPITPPYAGTTLAPLVVVDESLKVPGVAVAIPK